MARLEFIHFEAFKASVDYKYELVWEKEAEPSLERLPQIFWADGSGWHEANIWALERRMSQLDVETIKSGMKHLYRYANFLEAEGVSWQHFPIRREERVTRRFRKHLLDAMKSGALANSTGTNCINAIVMFYRFANSKKLIRPGRPMWADRPVVILIHDAAGFERSMVRLSTDLAISNRKRIGTILEDGLLPLSAEQMIMLLAYTAKHATYELHLMLSTGFFTGARLGTITTLTVKSLDTARVDPHTPGLYLLPVGPKTGVSTKFSVSGNLLVPKAILVDLKNYATSKTRLLREIKAHRDNKDVLFLTRSARPYTVGSVDSLILGMRKKAIIEGLQFMQDFKFHQSRATFGTWLLTLLLEHFPVAVAIGIVRDAMLHKDEAATMAYIKFLNTTHAKGELAAAFNAAFTGLKSRDWNTIDA